MKKTLSIMLTLALLLTLVLGTSLPSGAVALRTAVVNVDVLNVRSGPGTSHSRITTVSRGTELPVVSEQTGWVQVTLSDGRTGWVSAEFVTLRTPQPTQWARVTVDALNVRSGPGTTFSRVASVNTGTVLPVMGSQNGWHQVRLSSGQVGWVSSTYVTLSTTNPANSAPAPSPAPSPSPAPLPAPTVNQQAGTVTLAALPLRSGPDVTFNAITTLPINSQVTILQTQGKWHQVRTAAGQTGWVFAQHVTLNPATPQPVPNPAPQPVPQPTPAPVANQQSGTVTLAALPLRSGPDTTFSAITTLGINSQVTILQTQGKWYQVRTAANQTGWVFAQHISINPVAPPPPPPVPTPIANQPGQSETQRFATVTVSALNVRTSPSTDADRITVLSLGTLAQVIGENGEWLQIRLSNGQTGWVFSEFVIVSTRTINPGSGNGSLAGKVIVIDPGHGGSPGAVGVTGLMEKVVVLDVSLRLADMLRRAGATVVMTRETDINVNLAPRVSIAQAVNADVFVSVHANAHPNPAIGGIETYYYQHKASGNTSRLLAQHIQRELVMGLGLRDIGVKHGNFHVIRETTMPSVLVELAFLSNAQEEALMRTDAFRQNSAEAIFRGLESYFRF